MAMGFSFSSSHGRLHSSLEALPLGREILQQFWSLPNGDGVAGCNLHRSSRQGPVLFVLGGRHVGYASASVPDYQSLIASATSEATSPSGAIFCQSTRGGHRGAHHPVVNLLIGDACCIDSRRWVPQRAPTAPCHPIGMRHSLEPLQQVPLRNKCWLLGCRRRRLDRPSSFCIPEWHARETIFPENLPYSVNLGNNRLGWFNWNPENAMKANSVHSPWSATSREKLAH